jgi:hypothetical protein
MTYRGVDFNSIIYRYHIFSPENKGIKSQHSQEVKKIFTH